MVADFAHRAGLSDECNRFMLSDGTFDTRIDISDRIGFFGKGYAHIQDQSFFKQEMTYGEDRR